MGHSRRDFLKVMALFSGAAGVAGVVPESIRRAIAIEPEAGSTWLDAEHIVILMQENRSFDHALGTLQGVRGFNDPRAIRHANGDSIFVQTDAAGSSYSPWRLDIKDTRVTWMGSIPHIRHSQVDAWNEGCHDRWIDAKRSQNPAYTNIPLTMGHYTREDIPFYYALADAFTVCDQSYCGVMSSTTPNRCVFWTGTIRDAQRTDSKVYIRNNEIFNYEILSRPMTWKTFPERLQEAGIPWKFYQNELTHSGGLSDEENAWLCNFGCNVLEFFGAYSVEAYPGSVLFMKERVADLDRRRLKAERKLTSETDAKAIARLRKSIDRDRTESDRLKTQLAKSGEARYKQLTPQQRALFDAAFVTNEVDPHYHKLEAIAFEDDGKQQHMNVPKGDIFAQFRKDVNDGKLPTVSWLSAPEKFSDHPSSAWYGAWYVSEVMDILTKNPEVWKKTIFILTYDENDGYFDHAPSFVAADPKRPETGGASAGIDTGIEYTYAEDELVQGVSEEDARTGPIGLGFRIPTIVASPWSRGGWVNSQVFDHSSTLRFLEEFVQQKLGKKVTEENISAWRRATAGDLTSCFRPHSGEESHLDYLNRDKFVASIQRARYKELPSNYTRLNTAQIKSINDDLMHTDATAHQEGGIRPACALPYELYADGAVSADGTAFELRLTAGNTVHAGRSAGAPFNVYLRNLPSSGSAAKMSAATYVVKAGDTLTPKVPLSLFKDGHYAVDVYGPNGFYRSFSGDSSAAKLQVSAGYEQNNARLTGNVQAVVRNTGPEPVTVTVSDNSYKANAVTREVAAGAEETIVLPLERSHGWYDFTVQGKGQQATARFAGRVESGRTTFSDPLMGGVA